ncbi:MAG: hypothetical protein KatS3mg071_2435 [Meiothermus sp.]|nr:MAG: hypothetical protein KatS3mg071_2435 [Meiothermus sp.]
MRLLSRIATFAFFPIWGWLAFPQIVLYFYVFTLPLEGLFAIEGLFTLSKGLMALFLLVQATRVRRPKIPWLPALLLTWRQVPRFRISLLAVVLLFWVFLSYFWSSNPSATWDRIQVLVQQVVGALLIAFFVFSRPKTLVPLMFFYSLGALIAASVGIVNYWQNPLNRTTFAGSADAADFAAVALLGALLGLGLWLVTTRHLLRWYGILCFVICTLGVVLSGTRSAWVAIIATLSFLILPRLGWKRMLLLLLVLGVIVVSLSQLPAVGQFLAYRVDSAGDSGGAGRTAIWLVGFELVERNPFFGNGFGTFVALFDQGVAARSALESIDTYYIIDGRGAHNIYLELLSEIGLVGLGIFLVWIMLLLQVSMRQAVHPDLILILKACLLAYLIQGAFLGILERKYLWLTIGLLHGLAMMTRGYFYASINSKP